MKNLILLLTLATISFADSYSSKPDVAPVKNDLYIKECGSCHFPYQAGLLPSSSWNKIMANLNNHFNSDASLDDKTFQILSKYLNENSAEKSLDYKRSYKIMASLRENQIPDSISTTPYIIQKHREIRKDLITQKEVKGLFNCIACHTTADKGIYGERDIKIPNFGRWEDD